MNSYCRLKIVIVVGMLAGIVSINQYLKQKMSVAAVMLVVIEDEVTLMMLLLKIL